MTLDFFLTAYDPSDLPGASIDPLGFERGYLFLADKILPGLTNVAARPRYFGVLCAGIHLADVDRSMSPRAAYERRRETVLRLERLWALANVLASTADDASHSRAGDVTGIRGVLYVQDRAAYLREKRQTQTSPEFKVLSRQPQYGVLGIYAAVAEGMRMLSDRRQLALTPDLGDRLAEAFVHETSMPDALRSAIKNNKSIALTTLADWGKRAHVSSRGGPEERRCLKGALTHDAVRSRMSEVLGEYPAELEEDELRRFGRIERGLRGDDKRVDLLEGLRAVLAYESAYRLAQLALERLLWLARHRGALAMADAAQDEVLGLVRVRLPNAVRKLESVLASISHPRVCADMARVEDVRRFLADADIAAGAGVEGLIDVVLKRHEEVQHGKFDRGRRKMPWIERVDGRIALTSTQVGGLRLEAMVPGDIKPHEYRTAATDALRVAAGL